MGQVLPKIPGRRSGRSYTPVACVNPGILVVGRGGRSFSAFVLGLSFLLACLLGSRVFRSRRVDLGRSLRRWESLLRSWLDLRERSRCLLLSGDVRLCLDSSRSALRDLRLLRLGLAFFRLSDRSLSSFRERPLEPCLRFDFRLFDDSPSESRLRFLLSDFFAFRPDGDLLRLSRSLGRECEGLVVALRDSSIAFWMSACSCRSRNSSFSSSVFRAISRIWASA